MKEGMRELGSIGEEEAKKKTFYRKTKEWRELWRLLAPEEKEEIRSAVEEELRKGVSGVLAHLPKFPITYERTDTELPIGTDFGRAIVTLEAQFARIYAQACERREGNRTFQIDKSNIPHIRDAQRVYPGRAKEVLGLFEDSEIKRLVLECLSSDPHKVRETIDPKRIPEIVPQVNELLSQIAERMPDKRKAVEKRGVVPAGIDRGSRAMPVLDVDRNARWSGDNDIED